MIDFRYHIVSLISVFLALALGLFLGSTTLQSTVTRNLKHQADTVIGHNRDLSTTNGQLTANNEGLVGFTAALQPYVVARRLQGDTVALVTAPGVDSSIPKDLTAALNQAGATVTADIDLQAGFLDATQDAELGQLAKELAHNRPLPRANGATQAAYELGRALLTRPGNRVVTRGRVNSILSTLAAGKMISIVGRPPVRQATLAVLLVPATSPAGAASAVAASQNSILISVAEQLRAAATGVTMLAPQLDPTQSDGPLKAARGDSTLTKTVSTVDAADLATGRIATVMALAAARSGRVGSFGLLKNETPIMTPSPSASTTP